METIVDIRFISLPFFIIFSLLFSILILRLRFKSQDFPLTTSQRWGLSIIGALYLVNSLLLLSQLLFLIGEDIWSPAYQVTYSRFDYSTNILSFLFILSFGLVFPRPVTKWSSLFKLLVLLGLFWVPMEVASLLWPVSSDPVILGTPHPVNNLGYIVAVYIPLFLWVPEYDKQQAPQMRMVLTLLVWGFLFDPVVKTTRAVTVLLFTSESLNIHIAEFTIVVLLFVLILKAVYHRRGNLMASDKLNLLLMVVSLSIGLITGLMRTWNTDPYYIVQNLNPITVSYFLLGAVGWLILRPLLFAYGLLRYQSFGPKVQAHKDMRLFISLSVGVVGFVALFFSLGPVNLVLGILAGTALGLLVTIVIYKVSPAIIDRLLPMSHDISSAPLRERRNTYHMGLLTTVVDGRIEDPYDREVLERLRSDLGISEREHLLLMRGFAQERPLNVQDEVEEAYLFYKDATLIGQAARSKRPGTKKRVGDMVTTVSRFFSDAMARGGSVVDSIEYGDWTLVVEVTRTLGLVVMVRGHDSPEIRQSMRDVLWEIRDKHQKEIENMMEGQQKAGHHKGVERLLERFIERGSA